jgi:hypothetical protein
LATLALMNGMNNASWPALDGDSEEGAWLPKKTKA